MAKKKEEPTRRYELVAVPETLGAWQALIEITETEHDESQRQLDVLPRRAAIAKWEELTGEKWEEDSVEP